MKSTEQGVTPQSATRSEFDFPAQLQPSTCVEASLPVADVWTLTFAEKMNEPRQIFAVLALLLSLVSFSEAEGKIPEFVSTEAYRIIVRSKSNAEVKEAIARLSEHYQKDLTAGKTSSESDRKLILKAIPVIIDRMDDADKGLAIDVFYVLASIQTDCPAPKKANWQEWWKRKQNGERINWTVRFNTGIKD